MLKYSLAATTLLAVGLSACLEDTSGPDCVPLNNTIVETRGDTVVTSSGLKYIETGAGTSTQEADWCSAVKVQYRGTLLDGTEFDAGPYDFTPGYGQVVVGMELGVIGMTVDSNRRLILPPSLGYGSRDAVNPQTGEVVIPANSTIVFDLELVSTQ
jgi:FKBP-type peptidyl-prolyl cis-trans isomerase